MSRPRWRWPVRDALINSVRGEPVEPGSGRTADLIRAFSAKKPGARAPRQTLTEGNYSSKTIGRLPMGGGVEALALFFRGNTQTHCQVGDLVGNSRDHTRPDDRDSHGLRLYQELRADASEALLHLEPVVVEAWSAEVRRVEHAGKQRSENSADRVHAEDIERVVGLEPALELVHAPEAHEARGSTDHERAGDADVAGGRRDRHQPCDGTRSRTEHRGLALEDPLAERPCQHRAGGRQEGVHEGERGGVVCFERGTGVETEPE